jgi:glucokinase
MGTVFGGAGGRANRGCAVTNVVVGVDLGGTSLLAAAVAEDGRVLGRAKRKTRASRGAKDVISRIEETVHEALSAASLTIRDAAAVGVGVPGPLDPVAGVVHCCPNLGPSWNELPLAHLLGGALGVPVAVENDVNVGAVGEYAYGAGRGAHDLLAIFVGTGIGGGLILDGRLRQGARFSAGEVGHMVLQAGGPACGCGQLGHAEALASRTAIERDVRAAIRGGRRSVVSELMDLDKGRLMTAGIIAQALQQGDEVVAEAVRSAQHYLGLLVSACVNLIDPEVVVIGGGLTERMGEVYLEPVRTVARQHYVNQSDVERVRIVPAALGDLSGAVGAAVVARERAA